MLRPKSRRFKAQSYVSQPKVDHQGSKVPFTIIEMQAYIEYTAYYDKNANASKLREAD